MLDDVDDAARGGHVVVAGSRATPCAMRPHAWSFDEQQAPDVGGSAAVSIRAGWISAASAGLHERRLGHFRELEPDCGAGCDRSRASGGSLSSGPVMSDALSHVSLGHQAMPDGVHSQPKDLCRPSVRIQGADRVRYADAAGAEEDRQETGAQKQRAGNRVSRRVEGLHAEDLVAQDA